MKVTRLIVTGSIFLSLSVFLSTNSISAVEIMQGIFTGKSERICQRVFGCHSIQIGCSFIIQGEIALSTQVLRPTLFVRCWCPLIPHRSISKSDLCQTRSWGSAGIMQTVGLFFFLRINHFYFFLMRRWRNGRKQLRQLRQNCVRRLRKIDKVFFFCFRWLFLVVDPV